VLPPDPPHDRPLAGLARLLLNVSARRAAAGRGRAPAASRTEGEQDQAAELPSPATAATTPSTPACSRGADRGVRAK
jgi:hypothetical protein